MNLSVFTPSLPTQRVSIHFRKPTSSPMAKGDSFEVRARFSGGVSNPAYPYNQKIEPLSPLELTVPEQEALAQELSEHLNNHDFYNNLKTAPHEKRQINFFTQTAWGPVRLKAKYEPDRNVITLSTLAPRMVYQPYLPSFGNQAKLNGPYQTTSIALEIFLSNRQPVKIQKLHDPYNVLGNLLAQTGWRVLPELIGTQRVETTDIPESTQTLLETLRSDPHTKPKQWDWLERDLGSSTDQEMFRLYLHEHSVILGKIEYSCEEAAFSAFLDHLVKNYTLTELNALVKGGIEIVYVPTKAGKWSEQERLTAWQKASNPQNNSLHPQIPIWVHSRDFQHSVQDIIVGLGIFAFLNKHHPALIQEFTKAYEQDLDQLSPQKEHELRNRLGLLGIFPGHLNDQQMQAGLESPLESKRNLAFARLFAFLRGDFGHYLTALEALLPHTCQLMRGQLIPNLQGLLTSSTQEELAP